jgi:hypothetical protein
MGTHFCREDVAIIQTAFDSSTLHSIRQDDEDAVTLRDVVRTHLGRTGLAELIGAVIRGDVAPLSRNESIPGIMGYVFQIKAVKIYRPVREPKPIPPGYLTYAAAATRIGTNTEVVRNMVAQELLRPPKRRIRGVKLVRADDVEGFVSRFVSVRSLAERFGTRSGAIARYLQKLGTKILQINLPGKGKKLFVTKISVEEIEIRPAQRSKAAGAH